MGGTKRILEETANEIAGEPHHTLKQLEAAIIPAQIRINQLRAEWAENIKHRKENDQ